MLKRTEHRMTQQFTLAGTIAELLYAVQVYGDSFYGVVDYEVVIKTEFVVEPKNQYSSEHITPHMNAVHTVQFYLFNQDLIEKMDTADTTETSEPATLVNEQATLY